MSGVDGSVVCRCVAMCYAVCWLTPLLLLVLFAGEFSDVVQHFEVGEWLCAGDDEQCQLSHFGTSICKSGQQQHGQARQQTTRRVVSGSTH